MSKLVYYQVRLNRPNKQYDITYNSAQSTLETILNPNFVGDWKSISDVKKIAIALSQTRDNISDDIGKIHEDGFEIDLKKMETNKKYSVMYDNSIYEVFKNEQNELVVSEIG